MGVPLYNKSLNMWLQNGTKDFCTASEHQNCKQHKTIFEAIVGQPTAALRAFADTMTMILIGFTWTRDADNATADRKVTAVAAGRAQQTQTRGN